MSYSRGDWTRKMITGPLHDQDALRRAREAHKTKIGTQSTFASGIYIGGLTLAQHSAELTEVAVTPDSFVVFDTHVGMDTDPAEEIGRIPRDVVNGIHVKDDSTPMLMNINLYVSWGGDKPGVAEFKFVNPIQAEKAAQAYRDHVIT